MFLDSKLDFKELIQNALQKVNKIIVYADYKKIYKDFR